MQKILRLSNGVSLRVDVEEFNNQKTCLNIDDEGEQIKCKVFPYGECYIVVPERLVHKEPQPQNWNTKTGDDYRKARGEDER